MYRLCRRSSCGRSSRGPLWSAAGDQGHMATRTRIGLCSTLGALCCALAARADAGSDAAPVCPNGGLAPFELKGTEHLTYALDVLGANLGTLELTLSRASGADRDRGAMLVEARGRSSDLITTNVKRIVGWSATV